MERVAAFVRGLDPRLKVAAALVLGPSLWLLPLWLIAGVVPLLLLLLTCLAVSQPLGVKMLRSVLFFLLFWVLVKGGVDALSGVPVNVLLQSAGSLGLRLLGLIAVGLCLALSTSARSLGLAVSWAVQPFVGRERAWKLALSLALVVHFLPLCLATMAQVQETTSRRCPGFGFFRRMTVIPQAVLRGLGQKTWNQTLAIAGRGLEGADAWKADFIWRSRDSLCAAIGVVAAVCLLFFL